MNTEERLRRASDEIDRVTASVTAPPMAELQRSSRRQSIAVTIGTAAAVFVLVGGVVLLLGGRSATTLEPAGPGETTTTSATTTTQPAESAMPRVVIPDPVAVSDASLAPTDESVLYPIDGAVRDADLADRFQGHSSLFADVSEVIVLGQLDADSPSPRAYALRGVFADDEQSSQAGKTGDCVLTINGAESSAACSPFSEPLVLWGQTNDGSTAVSGRVSDGARLVVLTSGSDTSWQAVRDGYFFATVASSPDDVIEFTSYDAAGEVIDSLTPPRETGQAVPTTTAPINTCSGADIAPSALALSSIPQPVANALSEIVDAARDCDYNRLEEIGGNDFTASFGGGDAADLWTMQEQQGDKPMYWLLSILDLPYGTIDTEQGTMYVWPAAYANQGAWDTTPQADIDALRGLYTEEDLQGFADFGGYYGYRVGITASGDWLFFVAGD